MTNERHQSDRADIAILGGGPAGLESALVLSRTRKRIIVFDDPEPPRNAASHGVHNYLGLDGVSPTDFREIAWKQIDKYDSVELCKEKIANVTKEEDGIFNITSDKETSIKAKKVILAIGYHDVYPNIPGFIECWSDTIFSCPFCDGYENRDQIWGIVVNSEAELERFPKMAQNWTSKIKVFISPKIDMKSSYQNELTDSHISVYRGTITNVNHTNTKVKSVLLESGEKIEVEALLWIPPIKPAPLIQMLVENLDLELNEQGYVKSDMMQQTNVKGLFAVGDVKGSMGAISAAQDGAVAAVSIAHEWYH